MSVVHKWLFTSLIAINVLSCMGIALNLHNALDNDSNREDPRNFIIFHLQRGYNIINERIPCQLTELGENRKANCDFSRKFYMHATACCSVRREETSSPPKDIICFDDGTCIDIGDPGVHPLIYD